MCPWHVWWWLLWLWFDWQDLMLTWLTLFLDVSASSWRLVSHIHEPSILFVFHVYYHEPSSIDMSLWAASYPFNHPSASPPPPPPPTTTKCVHRCISKCQKKHTFQVINLTLHLHFIISFNSWRLFKFKTLSE